MLACTNVPALRLSTSEPFRLYCKSHDIILYKRCPCFALCTIFKHAVILLLRPVSVAFLSSSCLSSHRLLPKCNIIKPYVCPQFHAMPCHASRLFASVKETRKKTHETKFTSAAIIFYSRPWMLPTNDGSLTLPPASPRPAIGRL